MKNLRLYAILVFGVIILGGSAFYAFQARDIKPGLPVQASQAPVDLNNKADLEEFLQKKMWGERKRIDEPQPIVLKSVPHAQNIATRINANAPERMQQQQKAMMQVERQRYCSQEGRGSPQCTDATRR